MIELTCLFQHWESLKFCTICQNCKPYAYAMYVLNIKCHFSCFLHKTWPGIFFRNIHVRWIMFICVYFCAQRRWLLDETLYIKMLPQRLPILGFFNIMQTRCQTPWKKCKDTKQQVSFPTTRVMRRTCLISNRLSLSHSAWDRDSSDNLTFLVCPVTGNPTSWLLFVHSTSTATQQYLTRAPWSSTTAVRATSYNL